MAQGGGVQGQVLTHPAHHDLARVEPEADTEVDTLGAPQLTGIAGDRLGQGQGGPAGPPGVVLLRHRGTEKGHDPIAGELVHGATEAAHPLDQDADQAAHDLRPYLWIHVLLEVHGPLHIGEQDRQLLPFPLPRVCARERRGGGRAGGRGEPGATVAAEPLPGLVRRPAGRADRGLGQRRTALGAEPPALPPARRAQCSHLKMQSQTRHRGRS